MKEQKRRRIDRRRIDQIQDPSFLTDVESIGIDELRRRRDMCGDLDVELSYYRRMLHGRMDLLSFELRRRSGEETRSLIEALPEILAGDHEPMPSRSPGEGRTIPIEAPDIPEVGRRPVDRALGDDFLARLPELSDEDLAGVQEMLAGTESKISRQRRSVFDALDRLQEELTSRYRDGGTDASESLDR